MYGGMADGGPSTEKLAPTAALFDPGYVRHREESPRRHPSSSNGRSLPQMANVGGAGRSSLVNAGAAGVGAGSYTNNNNNMRRTSAGNGNGAQPQTGRNKPVPDVPPPVSSLMYTRPPPGSRDNSETNAYYGQPQALYQAQAQRGNGAEYAGYGVAGTSAAAAGIIGRPTSASPALATQGVSFAPHHAQRTSAPLNNATNGNGNFQNGPPVHTPQERAEALKRAKSVASIKSIPAEKLGKGAGYASPMPPLDPLGKPLDQKTWRERQSRIKSGEVFNPDTVLTPEQKMRRDSQIAKLNALRDGTASSKPGLSNLREAEEPVETSPLLYQGDDSFDISPERTSAMLPVRPTTSRNSANSGNNYKRESESILPYASPEVNRLPARTSSMSGPSPQNQIQRSRTPPSGNTIYPSLPPNSPTRNAAFSQSTQVSPSQQPRYELHQPTAQRSQNPIRASFASAPLSSSTNGGPPPAPSSQAFNNGGRLPAIPGSRPSSMSAPSTALPEYRRTSVASYTNNTPYAAAASPMNHTNSPNPFFQQNNASGNSFGNSSSSGRGQHHVSLADEIYGGLTHGLSDRDLARLSQSQQPGRK